MPEFSTEIWACIVVGLVVVFVAGVFVRVRKLMRISREIESKLDYSKMNKWEDEDDDWREPEGSLVDRQRDQKAGPRGADD